LWEKKKKKPIKGQNPQHPYQNGRKWGDKGGGGAVGKKKKGGEVKGG